MESLLGFLALLLIVPAISAAIATTANMTNHLTNGTDIKFRWTRDLKCRSVTLSIPA
ncbi:MAG: hypothetical protein RMY64_36065 [Nostoc sp. DedQUE08]|uniref:hypothetical protein n=1 Tax=unclassified Nostoc TaxID=2593658 RepID=UPI002AD5ADE7|nr:MULTISPECIES: hypothetical protein [unclassified Nostoc]MDZ8070977.1 hypothetical protein [Nostoc sp. DedQUE08]MDZ8132468.1 hypothetical protein [Nostoc sp. DedQUE07]